MRYLILMLLVGCAVCDVSPEPDVVHYVSLDPNGSDKFNEAVANAAAQWDAIGCLLQVSDTGTPVVQVRGDWPTESHDYQGYFDGHTIFIRSDYTVDAYLQKKMMLHEMGHFLGFGHRDYGIMTPHVDVDVLTQDDCP